jgi:RND family efflux transporter MFP subunit
MKHLNLKSTIVGLSAAALVHMVVTTGFTEDRRNGPTASVVKISEVVLGTMRPTAEFVGTVFYQEVSDVASEIDGLAEVVRVEDGDRVSAGQSLVELKSTSLRKQLDASRASHGQALADLQIARIDLARKEKLFQRNSIAEQQYDENRFRVKALEKRAAALQAEVERIEIELRKTAIRAPFTGVILERSVDRGEWLSKGETVAVLAKDDVIDVVAEIPERFIRFVKPNMEVQISVDGWSFSGTVIAVVRKADTATRTFPVKIRTANPWGLSEGMSARVILPTGAPQESLLVPRDALISQFGQHVVFSVTGSRADMIPVEVVGYDGLTVGVRADTLKAGMSVVTSGNERLRDGQTVAVAKAQNGEAR